MIHSPPDIPLDSEILGVCAVSSENADPNKYGWMVTDFLAWKTLFHRVGQKNAQVCAELLILKPIHSRFYSI